MEASVHIFTGARRMNQSCSVRSSRKSRPPPSTVYLLAGYTPALYKYVPTSSSDQHELEKASYITVSDFRVPGMGPQKQKALAVDRNKLGNNGSLVKIQAERATDNSSHPTSFKRNTGAELLLVR